MPLLRPILQQPPSCSLDYLVGASEERRWNFYPQGLCCSRIDKQLHLCDLLHWQLTRLFAFENPSRVDACLAVRSDEAATETDKPTSNGEIAGLVNSGHSMANCQGGKLLAPIGKEWVRSEHQTAYSRQRQLC